MKIQRRGSAARIAGGLGAGGRLWSGVWPERGREANASGGEISQLNACFFKRTFEYLPAMAAVVTTRSESTGGATKARLMEVAERLFAERGFDVVSLRQITSQAGTNLAAVNYHFGSKEELILAIVRRWVEPLNRNRLKLLRVIGDEMLREGRRAAPAEIVEAFLRPVLELHHGSEQSKRVFLRLLGRCMLETRRDVSEALLKEFRPVYDAFAEAFRCSLPHLSAQEITMRMMFMAGAMAHSTLNLERFAAIHGRPSAASTEVLLRQMVEFAAAGFAAGGAGGEGVR